MAAGDVKIISENHATRAAMVMNGADDYAEIDAFTAAQVLAGDTAGTFTAWINLDDYDAGDYVVISSGDANVIEYISFGIKDGQLVAKCLVATVVQWDIESTESMEDLLGLEGIKGWHQIALRQKGTRPNLFLDGVELAVTDNTATDLTAWYSVLTGGDVGAIGLLNMNATQTLDCKGAISDVKYFSVDLTDAQMAAEFAGQGATRNTHSSEYPNAVVNQNLISHWTMNSAFSTETLEDISDYVGTYTNLAYPDNAYSELTKQAHSAWVAAGDNWEFVVNNGQFFILHVEGV